MPTEGAQPTTTEQRLDALEGSVAALAHEIRTRRLLVAGDNGGPQVVCEVSRGIAELRLQAGDGGPSQPTLVLYASGAGEGADPDAAELGPATGLQLWADGDAVVELDAWDAGAGRWGGRLHVEGGGS
jgi:hypothetical protein